MSDTTKPKLDMGALMVGNLILKDTAEEMGALMESERVSALQALGDQVALAAARINELSSALEAERQTLFEYKSAVLDYAGQSGGGSIMLDNIKLCLEQIKAKNDKLKKQGRPF